MIYLTRKEHFNAAHKLFVNAWSEEKNNEVFGKCANKYWHGHNYDLYVTVKGEPNTETGFIIDVKKLSILIKKEICEVFDHKNLNEDVIYFKTIQPSTENLAKVIWDILNPKITEGKLHCIKLFETENIYVEYYGE